jgi:hypothetical protein
MKYITQEWLEKNDACIPGMDWYGDRRMTVPELIDALITEKRWDWANWLLTRVLDKRGNVRYALFAARQCEPLSYDPCVKQCNDTVQAWLDGKATLEQVESAAEPVEAAAWSERAAVWSAAGSAERAARAAGSAERAAESAEAAERAAVWSATWASAWSAAWKTIIAEGLRIYEGDE